jgi:hypothetical protein
MTRVTSKSHSILRVLCALALCTQAPIAFAQGTKWGGSDTPPAPTMVNPNRIPKPHASPPPPPKRVTAKCHPTYDETSDANVDASVKQSLPANTYVEVFGLMHTYWEFALSEKENNRDFVLCQYKTKNKSPMVYDWKYRFACKGAVKKTADTWECDG